MRELEESGAAVALLGEVTGGQLREAVGPLVDDLERRATMAAAVRAHGRRGKARGRDPFRSGPVTARPAVGYVEHGASFNEHTALVERSVVLAHLGGHVPVARVEAEFVLVLRTAEGPEGGENGGGHGKYRVRPLQHVQADLLGAVGSEVVAQPPRGVDLGGMGRQVLLRAAGPGPLGVPLLLVPESVRAGRGDEPVGSPPGLRAFTSGT
ncbi:hypothetical protein [Streptomyces sp. NPDC058629]|uniref:hypothetical protein n=1 Tax=Streptomyces sp. NPDC058629 TaxID=3346565 RepID=UPI003656DC44